MGGIALRNFWIEAKVDGRKTALTGGPVQKDGGFSLQVFMRNEGESMEVVDLWGHVMRDGTLQLNVKVDGHEEIVLNNNR